MKLRQHLREIRQNFEDHETLLEVEESTVEEITHAGPSTEEDLMGMCMGNSTIFITPFHKLNLNFLILPSISVLPRPLHFAISSIFCLVEPLLWFYIVGPAHQ